MNKTLFPGLTAFLILVSVAPAQSQEPLQSESVVEAARSSREREKNSARHPKIITNADLETRNLTPTVSAFALGFPSASAAEVAEVASPAAADCDNPQAAKLQADLQAAQQQLDQLRSQLSYQPPVISDNDLDLQQFRPGSSGLTVDAPPLLETAPPPPARIAEVELEETIAALTEELRLACEPPEAARAQMDLDSAQHQLELLQREFALDQDTYYSNPDYAEDTAGQARLDAGQQQIESLQTEIENLKQQLATLNPPQPAS